MIKKLLTWILIGVFALKRRPWHHLRRALSGALFFGVGCLIAVVVVALTRPAASNANPVVSKPPAQPVATASDTSAQLRGTPELIAHVDYARALTFDDDGNLYTLGRDSGEVFQITPQGKVGLIVKLGAVQSGYIGPWYDTASKSLIISNFAAGDKRSVHKLSLDGRDQLIPVSMQAVTEPITDKAGNIYVGSFTTCPGYIEKITPSGERSIYGKGICAPGGMAFDGAGNLFVADRQADDIKKIPAGGGNATAFATGFAEPMAIAFDGNGNLIVASYKDSSISVVRPDGAITRFTNSFDSPVALAFDRQGNLYVSSYTGDIYKFVTK